MAYTPCIPTNGLLQIGRYGSAVFTNNAKKVRMATYLEEELLVRAEDDELLDDDELFGDDDGADLADDDDSDADLDEEDEE